MPIKYACVYTTRQCQNHCKYCSLRDASLNGPELTGHEWAVITMWLKDHVDFALFLGNECWRTAVEENYAWARVLVASKLPYAMYTSLSMLGQADALFNIGIDNVSVGVDFPSSAINCGDAKLMNDDSFKKSMIGLTALKMWRHRYPQLDLQATCTISSRNHMYLPLLIQECAYWKINLGLNFIHFNTDYVGVDRGFDFFPRKTELPGWSLAKCQLRDVSEIVNMQKVEGSFIQNIADMQALVNIPKCDAGGNNECWHCLGNPYGGPSIDADGSLRCCGYRKGKRTSKLNIWDLMSGVTTEEQWKMAVIEDSQECPGCTWSYPRLFSFYENEDPDFGLKVVQRHARKGVDSDEWSQRSF